MTPIRKMRPTTALIASLVALCCHLPAAGSPGDRELYEKAELARKEGRVKEALPLFRQALEKLPGDLDTHLGYQKLFQSLGKEDQLVEEYGKLLEEHEKPLYFFLLGRVLHEPAREEELYRRGLEKDSENFELHEGLASALWRQLERKEAAKEYLEAMRLRPDSVRAHARYMSLIEELGSEQSLPERYRERVEKDPGNHISHLLHGIAHATVRDLEKAEISFQKAADIAP